MTAQTFIDYDRIEAVLNGIPHEELWKNPRLPPFQTELQEARESKTLSIPVCSEAEIQPYRELIDKLRPDKHNR